MKIFYILALMAMATATKITIGYMLECPPEYGKYSFQLDLWEKDTFSADDYVTSIAGSAEGIYTNTLNTNYSEGDGPLNGNYEFKVVVKHNCAPIGSIQPELQTWSMVFKKQCAIVSEECSYSFFALLG